MRSPVGRNNRRRNAPYVLGVREPDAGAGAEVRFQSFMDMLAEQGEQ
jgi:hypothetical protein